MASVASSYKAGASAVEERWHAPAADEDFWLPVRPNANTRVETLPGAQNLGDIDDAIYFRQKLWMALKFPKNFMSGEEGANTRIALSAQDVRFARHVERLQSYFEEGLWQIADRHLSLRGFPRERYADLQIKLTPPSAWKEMSDQEVLTARYNNAGALKGSMLLDDFTILTEILKKKPEEAEKIMSRMKIQKMEELKLQIIATNPQLLGIGTPGAAGGPEMGTEPGGPTPLLGRPCAVAVGSECAPDPAHPDPGA